MNFTVKSNWNYKELVVESDNAKITTGLLNPEERISLARELIDAAYDLIYNDNDELGKRLCDFLNESF